jgi:hypothetical protein
MDLKLKTIESPVQPSDILTKDEVTSFLKAVDIHGTKQLA